MWPNFYVSPLTESYFFSIAVYCYHWLLLLVSVMAFGPVQNDHIQRCLRYCKTSIILSNSTIKKFVGFPLGARRNFVTFIRLRIYGLVEFVTLGILYIIKEKNNVASKESKQQKSLLSYIYLNYNFRQTNTDCTLIFNL